MKHMTTVYITKGDLSISKEHIAESAHHEKEIKSCFELMDTPSAIALGRFGQTRSQHDNEIKHDESHTT